jgi:hypothetical protein
MSNVARVLGTFAASAALLCGAFTVAAAAGVETTKPSQMVLLTASGAACPVAGKLVDTQVRLDGTQVPFTIPAKEVLVITEIDWFVVDAVVSKSANFALTLQDPGGVVPAVGVFFDTALADSIGQAGHIATVSNLVVRPGPALCTTAAGPTTSVVVRGFLTKDK